MSAFDIAKIPCPDIQADLADFYTTAAMSQYTDVPLALFLTSDVNTANVESIGALVGPGSGKKRVVQTIYTPRILESELSEDVAFTCSTEQESGMLSSTCEVDLAVGVFSQGERFQIADLAAICEQNPSYISKRLAAHLDGLVRKMETSLHTQIIALKGGFSSNDNDVASDIKTVVTATSGVLDYSALEEILYTMQTVYSQDLYTFGGGRITKYVNALGNGCCTDFGVDLGSYFGNSGWRHIADFRAEAATQANGFFGLIPGAAHIAYVNQFGGTNMIDTDVYKQFTVTHGPTGLPFDVTWKVDCGDLIVQAGLAFTVCAAPTDMFAIGDDLSGYNGILEFLASAT